MKNQFLRTAVSIAILCATSTGLSYAAQPSDVTRNDKDALVNDLPENITAIPNVNHFSTDENTPSPQTEELGTDNIHETVIEDAEVGETRSVERAKPVFTQDNWCKTKGDFDFAFVNDDFAGFHLKKGTLSGNIERFVALMYPESNGLISKVGRHLVAGDMCIVADTPNQILQLIIEPYFIGNVPIYFASFKNDFHALFYKDDEEFMRYRIGVRR